MNPERFARARLEQLFSAALEAVDPARAVVGAVQRKGDQIEIAGELLRPGARLVVLAVGKAAGTMAHALEALVGDRIAAGWCKGHSRTSCHRIWRPVRSHPAIE